MDKKPVIKHSDILGGDFTIYPSGNISFHDGPTYERNEWLSIKDIGPDNIKIVHNIKTIFKNSKIEGIIRTHKK